MIGKRSEFKVLNTTPPQPASNERATISALLETGDDESRNGFLNFTPQKSTDKSMLLITILPPSSMAQKFQIQGLVRLVLLVLLVELVELVELVGLNRTNGTN
jgi:hypothetical protein